MGIIRAAVEFLRLAPARFLVPIHGIKVVKLSMNRPTPDPSQEGSERSSAPCQFPSWEGLGVGSWPQRAVARPRGLSLNLLGHQIAASLGKSGAEDALQTLTRGPLTRPRARSVWSASDLSALSRSGAGYSVVQGLNACETPLHCARGAS